MESRPPGELSYPAVFALVLWWLQLKRTTSHIRRPVSQTMRGAAEQQVYLTTKYQYQILILTARTLTAFGTFASASCIGLHNTIRRA